jgi:hypothetical protein
VPCRRVHNNVQRVPAMHTLPVLRQGRVVGPARLRGPHVRGGAAVGGGHLPTDVAADKLRQMDVPHALVRALQVSGGDVRMEQGVRSPPGHNATMQGQQEVRLLCEQHRNTLVLLQWKPSQRPERQR